MHGDGASITSDGYLGDVTNLYVIHFLLLSKPLIHEPCTVMFLVRFFFWTWQQLVYEPLCTILFELFLTWQPPLDIVFSVNVFLSFEHEIQLLREILYYHNILWILYIFLEYYVTYHTMFLFVRVTDMIWFLLIRSSILMQSLVTCFIFLMWAQLIQYYQMIIFWTEWISMTGNDKTHIYLFRK